ncbi:DUF7669 domain-containing protein [Vallitalea guaymasensis]|uniref:DUF7669 domain-containing protein n=1 Tax=Vallitalea guaymasensis TaxID=1185412 RepID=UPI00272B0677|nr:hypothetical protein [Vallitalea guaymasensis]
MGFYKLQYNDNLREGKLIEAQKDSIDYEKTFEDWLENSPYILYDDEGETVLWISRQEGAKIGDSVKRPDMIGINSDGNIVICELKKGRAPREVIAQVLEYCAWASRLSYNELNNIFKQYRNINGKDKELINEFRLTFNFEDEEFNESDFNKGHELFVYAEEFTNSLISTAEFLSSAYNIPLKLIKYVVHRTEEDDIFISTESLLLANSFRKKGLTEYSYDRWSEDKKLKDIVYDYVLKYLEEKNKNKFTPIDIIRYIIKDYPNMKKSSIRCQLIQDCVNHTSRKHYPSGQRDLYYLVTKGKYRLYEKNDGKYNFEGKKSTN